MNQLSAPVRIGLVCLVSLLVLIRASYLCDRGGHGSCTSRMQWGIACSAISFAATLLLLALWKAGQWGAPLIPGAKGGLATGMLLTVWWIAGVAVLTFGRSSPFGAEGAVGFFGSWGSLMLSVGLLAQHMPELSNAAHAMSQNGSALMYIWCASVVMVAQAPNDWGSSNNAVWAFIVGLTSLVLTSVAILARHHIPAQFAGAFSALLAALWLGCFIPVTIVSPYTSMGNGFLAAGVGLLFSTELTLEHYGVLGALGFTSSSQPPQYGSPAPPASAAAEDPAPSAPIASEGGENYQAC